MRRTWSVLSLAVEHPIAATVGTVAVTLLFALFIPRVAIDTSADGFIVQRDPARVLYERFRQEFGTDSLTLIVVKADNVFQPDVLAAVRRITDRMEQMPEVMRVESLAT